MDLDLDVDGGMCVCRKADLANSEFGDKSEEIIMREVTQSGSSSLWVDWLAPP